jgi:CheY-like chemotaxis protein
MLFQSWHFPVIDNHSSRYLLYLYGRFPPKRRKLLWENFRVTESIPTKPNLKKKKVLLVEDDASMRRFVKVVLNRANYEVMEAADGLAALEYAKENHFDAVLADAVMPNISGFDLCRMLRADKRHDATRFIILSGFSSQLRSSQNPSDGLIDAYLEKDTNLATKLPSILDNLWKD